METVRGELGDVIDPVPSYQLRAGGGVLDVGGAHEVPAWP